MVKRNSKSLDTLSDEEKGKLRVPARVPHYTTTCKCGHRDSLPAFSQESADDFGRETDCNACMDKEHDNWKTEHYTWMKAYNDKKRAEKAREAAAEAKRKKQEETNRKRERATSKKKGKGATKGKSAGVII